MTERRPAGQFRDLSVVVCSYSVPPARLCKLLDGISGHSDIRLTGVVVCNGAHGTTGAPEGWSFIPGSNEDLDFSAYREGLAWLQRSVAPIPGSVLFVNDSIFTKHNARRILADLLALLDLLESTEAPAIVGKADPYDNICYASPWSGLPLYVSSFCFLLNGKALPELAALGQQADSDLGSTEIDVADPSWGLGLTSNFRSYLRAHLLYPENSLSWYQMRRHSGNPRLIAKKARCVYAEHRLSGEIGRQGVLINLYPLLRMKIRFFMSEQWAKAVRTICGTV